MSSKPKIYEEPSKSKSYPNFKKKVNVPHNSPSDGSLKDAQKATIEILEAAISCLEIETSRDYESELDLSIDMTSDMESEIDGNEADDEYSSMYDSAEEESCHFG